MSTLADFGEDRLVATLLAQLPSNVLVSDEIIAGAGDDCAVVAPAAAGNVQLLKTDCVVEGVHYAPGTEPERVGWKAMCRPLSDVAAMGGTPLHALVTLALPASASVDDARGIYKGLGRAAACYGVRVVGGETVRSPTVGFVSVALTGTVQAQRWLGRATGRRGDLVYVTGRLGGSFLSGKHLDFLPRLHEARWLAASFPVSAMMDVSDGVGCDLPRLAKASGTGYALRPEAVPCSPGCSVAQALGDGEDYELLFAVQPQAREPLEQSWRVRWPKLELTCIGELTTMAASPTSSGTLGFDHFKAPA